MTEAHERIGIISVDGHVASWREGYRDYLDPDFRDDDPSTFRVRADRVMFGCDFPHFEATRVGVRLDEVRG